MAADTQATVLAGLDSLEAGRARSHPWSARSLWATAGPKLLAVGLVIGAW